MVDTLTILKKSLSFQCNVDMLEYMYRGMVSRDRECLYKYTNVVSLFTAWNRIVLAESKDYKHLDYIERTNEHLFKR